MRHKARIRHSTVGARTTLQHSHLHSPQVFSTCPEAHFHHNQSSARHSSPPHHHRRHVRHPLCTHGPPHPLTPAPALPQNLHAGGSPTVVQEHSPYASTDPFPKIVLTHLLLGLSSNTAFRHKHHPNRHRPKTSPLMLACLLAPRSGSCPACSASHPMLLRRAVLVASSRQPLRTEHSSPAALHEHVNGCTCGWLLRCVRPPMRLPPLSYPATLPPSTSPAGRHAESLVLLICRRLVGRSTPRACRCALLDDLRAVVHWVYPSL